MRVYPHHNKSIPARCHPERLHYAKGLCSPCYQVQLRNKEGRREFVRDYNRKRYDKARARDVNLRRYFGITLADYHQMLEMQGGRCAGCFTDEPGGRWGTFCVDHDHSTNEVRGLLCDRCNKALGYVSDTPETLRRLADYLEKGAHRWQPN